MGWRRDPGAGRRDRPARGRARGRRGRLDRQGRALARHARRGRRCDPPRAGERHPRQRPHAGAQARRIAPGRLRDPRPGRSIRSRLRRGVARPGAALRPAGGGASRRARAAALRRARHGPRVAQAHARDPECQLRHRAPAGAEPDRPFLDAGERDERAGSVRHVQHGRWLRAVPAERGGRAGAGGRGARRLPAARCRSRRGGAEASRDSSRSASPSPGNSLAIR